MFLKQLQENKALLCIDQGEDLVIRGQDEIESIVLNINYMAAHDTIKTLDEIKAWLGHPELIVYSNK